MDKKVLIVDDDEEVCEFVKAVFKTAGIPVVSASSGPKCLELLRAGFEGIVLLDVMMPEMDGWHLLKEMDRAGFLKGILVCLFTAKSEPDPALDEFKDHVVDYFRKPVDPERLVSRVREYMKLLN